MSSGPPDLAVLVPASLGEGTNDWWVGGWVNEWMDGWMEDGWVDGGVHGWVGGWIACGLSVKRGIALVTYPTTLRASLSSSVKWD